MKRIHPPISIVIPVHNAGKTIEKCLKSLSELDYPDYEVIFVDDGSTDDTADICAAHEWVRLIRQDKGGPGKARNAGIAAARGEVIAFTDGDCIVEREWLKELAQGFAEEDVAGVGGDQKSPDDETDTGRLIQDFLKSIGFMTDYIKTGSALRETNHNPSCNVAYRKSVLDEVRGFDETLWPGEDVELDLRIRRRGYRLIYNPAAVVGHYRPSTYGGFAAMMRRYGACQRELVKRYGLFRRLHYEPVALALVLAFAAGLLWWEPRAWPILLLPVPIFFLWFYLKTKRFAKSLYFLLLLLITLVNWNWGFLKGGASFPNQ
jgi:glycosyltransferase involved in cell wall biosynthesis